MVLSIFYVSKTDMVLMKTSLRRFTEEDKLLMDIMQMKAAADEEKETINKGAEHDKEIRDKGKEIREKALADRVEKSPDLGKPNCSGT